MLRFCDVVPLKASVVDLLFELTAPHSIETLHYDPVSSCFLLIRDTGDGIIYQTQTSTILCALPLGGLPRVSELGTPIPTPDDWLCGDESSVRLACGGLAEDYQENNCEEGFVCSGVRLTTFGCRNSVRRCLIDYLRFLASLVDDAPSLSWLFEPSPL